MLGTNVELETTIKNLPKVPPPQKEQERINVTWVVTGPKLSSREGKCGGDIMIRVIIEPLLCRGKKVLSTLPDKQGDKTELGEILLSDIKTREEILCCKGKFLLDNEP